MLIATYTISSSAQDVTNPTNIGDNFNLEGALTLFKQSNSLEDFENKINTEENDVNNLDLNNDGDIDYINVTDIYENKNHIIVLSTFTDNNEKQDIATIDIEKTGDENATLQIVGDEDLYQTNTILEPSENIEKIESNSKGPAIQNVTFIQIRVNVWMWPCVRYIYAPNYVIWTSPYHWRYYPRYWKPWKTYHYNVFYKKGIRYKSYSYRVNKYRNPHFRKNYYVKRNKSIIQRNRYNNRNHSNIRNINRSHKNIRNGRR